MIKSIGLSLVLIAIVFFAFANAVRHPFVHDDIVFIQQNPHLANLNWQDIFFSPATKVLDGANTYYRPLLEFIYRLEYQWFGLNPHGFHALNIVWHAVNALLVVLLCRQLNLPFIFAWVVGLFFAIHPVQSESVACVAGVSNIVVTSFILMALIAHIRRWFVITLLMIVVGALAKESALIILPLTIIIDWLLRRRLWGAWCIYAVGSIGFLVWRHALTGQAVTADVLSNPTELGVRLLHIPTALVGYLSTLLWPGDLHYYRNLDILKPWWPWWIVLSVIIAILKLISPSDRQERRLFWFGWWVLIIGLLPVLNILPLINEYSLILRADHFLYFPIIGFLISAGCLLRQWLLPSRQSIIVLITALLALMLTLYQNTLWRSEVALFERTVQYEPSFGRGQALLAKAYYFSRRFNKAIEHYGYAQNIFERYLNKTEDQKARRFYAGFLKGIHFEKAHVYGELKKWPESYVEYVQAINIDPNDAVLYSNAATVLMVQMRWEEAKAMLQKALALSPSQNNARNNLAVCYVNTGYPDIAKTIWQQILETDPSFLPAKQNLEKAQ